MSWQDVKPQATVFFEGEDPEALKARFITLSAYHRQHGYTPYEIALHVFKENGLRDAESRAGQCAVAWADLETDEKVRVAMSQRETATAWETKDEWKLELAKLIADRSIGDKEKKVRIEGMKLYAESQGWIVKQSSSSVETKGGGLPQIVIAQYAD